MPEPEHQDYSLDPPRPLSIRERKFIKAVCEGKTQTEAVYLAGYKPTMTAENAKKLGSQVAKRPHVATEIDKRMGELGITPEWVDTKILNVGNDPAANHMAVLKAAELGGKRLKLFETSPTLVQDNREQHIHIEVSGWSEPELLQFLATGKLPAGKETDANHSPAAG